MPGRSNNTANPNPNDNYKFTGHERDDEAGLDVYFANARMYGPAFNRFKYGNYIKGKWKSVKGTVIDLKEMIFIK